MVSAGVGSSRAYLRPKKPCRAGRCYVRRRNEDTELESNPPSGEDILTSEIVPLPSEDAVIPPHPLPPRALGQQDPWPQHAKGERGQLELMKAPRRCSSDVAM